MAEQYSVLNVNISRFGNYRNAIPEYISLLSCLSDNSFKSNVLTIQSIQVKVQRNGIRIALQIIIVKQDGLMGIAAKNNVLFQPTHPTLATLNTLEQTMLLPEKYIKEIVIKEIGNVMAYKERGDIGFSFGSTDPSTNIANISYYCKQAGIIVNSSHPS